jgi:hypothetical protein
MPDTWKAILRIFHNDVLGLTNKNLSKRRRSLLSFENQTLTYEVDLKAVAIDRLKIHTDA